MMRWGLLGLGFASTAVAGTARAQGAEISANAQRQAGPVSLGREAVQLSLRGTLLDYLKQTARVDPPPGYSAESQEQDASATSLGLLGSSFGLGVGYALDQLLFGARVEVSSTARSPFGGGESHATAIGFLPRVELMFSTDSMRPYVAGLFAIEHGSSSTDTGTSSATAATHTESSSTRFGVGAAFGVHFFLNHSVSLDPEVSMVPSWGAGTGKASNDLNEISQDFSLKTLRFTASFGLSAWLDTAGPPRAVPARDESVVTPTGDTTLPAAPPHEASPTAPTAPTVTAPTAPTATAPTVPTVTAPTAPNEVP